MPPSNKKKRGRQRRNANANKDSSVAVAAVAAAAKEGDEDVLDDLMVSMSLLKLTGTVCTHGFPDVPQGHVAWDALKFLGTQESSEGNALNHPSQAIKDMTARFPQIAVDHESYSFLKKMLLSLGAKTLLENPHDLSGSWCLSFHALSLEARYDLLHADVSERFNFEKHRHPVSTKFLKKARDLTGGGRRGLIVFFEKQIPCNCLREMYEEILTTQKKMGQCESCAVEKEYKSLKKCQRCDIAHYCNRECQVDHWPNHKFFCKKTKS